MSTANDMKMKGNECLSKKNFAEAVEWYTKGIEMEPSNHILYSNRSAAYLSMKSYDKALQDADKCIQLNPSWDKGYNRKAAVQQATGEFEGCKETIENGRMNIRIMIIRFKGMRQYTSSSKNS